MSVPRIRMVLAVLGAVLVSSAVVSSSALAAMGWFVGGARLASGSSQGIAATARVTEGAVLSVPSLSLKLTCGSLSEEGAEIEGTTLGRAKHLFYENCSEIEPATCMLASKNLVVAPILALPELVGSPTKLLLLFHPETGNEFAKIDFVKNKAQSKACAGGLVGEKPVLGAVNLMEPTGLSENTEQEIEGLGTTSNNSLEVAGDKGYIEGGKAFLKLCSGASWSYQE
jgi:hypothetical protein